MQGNPDTKKAELSALVAPIRTQASDASLAAEFTSADWRRPFIGY
jgi:hypothetical protein